MGKEIALGTSCTYVPGENDFAARPKKTAMPAIVTGVSEKEIGKDKTIKVYNLTVSQDNETGFARRLRVKHASDAIKGEAHFTVNGAESVPNRRLLKKAPKKVKASVEAQAQ